MDQRKMIDVIEQYEAQLKEHRAVRLRMATNWTFGEASARTLLNHAYYLCEGAKEFAIDPEKYGKANRHLTAIQMCLSFAGWYTLADLMEHNRSAPHNPNFVPKPFR